MIGTGRQRLPELARPRGAEATGVENAADLLGRSHQPFGYVKPVSEIIHWFTDPIFHKVAFEEANELLTPSEVAQVHEALSSSRRASIQTIQLPKSHGESTSNSLTKAT